MALHGVLGDIHGNREALEAALAALDARGIARLLCVGDLIGYNADPDACVAILRARGAVCIAGNHDLIGTGRLGFERCSNKAMHSLQRTRRILSEETRGALAAIPAHALVGEHVLLTHGGVRDVQQYMTRPAHVLENAGYLRADFPGRRVCFFGHTHEQRVFEVDGEAVADVPATGRVALRADREYFVNPGSVDASRKHGEKWAEFAIFDDERMTVEFGRTSYDAQSTEAKAAAGGFRIDRWRDRLYDVRRRLIGPRQKEQPKSA
jgi:predicted phosphodiesterase